MSYMQISRPVAVRSFGQDESTVKKAAMGFGEIIIGIGVLVMVWWTVFKEKKAKRISHTRSRKIRVQPKPIPG